MLDKNFDLLVVKPEFVLKTAMETNDEILMRNRYSDGIVTVVRGELEFDFGDTVILCGNGESVFIPKASDYKIRCIRTAESRIVNFYTNDEKRSPLGLPAIDSAVCEGIFTRLETLLQKESENRNGIFSLYYRLFSEFFDKNEKYTDLPEAVRNAEKIMLERMSDSALSCQKIADMLNISEVYLRKLFSKHISASPSAHLRRLRMETAKKYLLEGYSVSAAAEKVGYSEIYQFSRAYKRYFGFSPSETEFV